VTRRVACLLPAAGRGLMVAVAAVAVLALSASVGRGQGIQIASGQQGRLRADRVRYDARAQVLLAEGNVHLTIGTLVLRSSRLRLEQKTLLAFAEGSVSVRQSEFSLEAGRVRYDIRRRSARAEGGAVLAQGGVAVRAVQIAFELEAQTVAASGGVVVTQGASTLTGVSLRANLKTREADVFGDAHLVRAAPAGAAASGSQDTQDAAIRAAHLRIRWGAVNEAEAEGSVIVRQGSIAARAQRARYSETAGRLVLEDEVVVAQFGDKEVTAGVTLTADQLVVLLRERDMEASGKVTVTQKGRTATGERGTYNEKEKRIILTGHVQMQDEEGNVIRADKVVIDLEAETFDASGDVETTFKVKRGK